MTKFTWNDTVTAVKSAALELRPGESAWVVGVCADIQRGDYHKKFPPGTVYTIEFSDGASVDAHEDDLVPIHTV